jgi:hypothetical protein
MGFGDSDNGDRQEFLIVVTGNFVASDVRPPPGATDDKFEPPKGKYIELVVDATTGDLTDSGIDSVPTDLASVGTVEQ